MVKKLFFVHRRLEVTTRCVYHGTTIVVRAHDLEDDVIAQYYADARDAGMLRVPKKY